MISAPIEQLNTILQDNQHISETLDHQLLNFLGVFIVRNAFKCTTIDSYACIYFKELDGPGLERNSLHLTEVKIHAQNRLNNIVLEPEFHNIAATFFQGNVGTDFIRVVKKDRTNVQPVFLHQDTCYQAGGFDRYSLFIPLTPCNFDNGGLVLYPGTHHFGYLGDAGEIADVLPPGYPKICPHLTPGDVLIMHSATWHESPENKTLSDRVYLEAHIQPSNDPTTKVEICGQRNSEWVMNLNQDQLFRNSRAQRIKRLQQEIENLKAVPA